MATSTVSEAALQYPEDARVATRPVAIVGTLVAGSFWLAAGVGLAILLFAALFSV